MSLIMIVLGDRWRLEHEEVVASAPDEESGAGVARREESCMFNGIFIITV
jgi:hypothetical protein